MSDTDEEEESVCSEVSDGETEIEEEVSDEIDGDENIGYTSKVIKRTFTAKNGNFYLLVPII